MQVVHVINMIVEESSAVGEIRNLRQDAAVNSDLYNIYLGGRSKTDLALYPLIRTCDDRFTKQYPTRVIRRTAIAKGAQISKRNSIAIGLPKTATVKGKIFPVRLSQE